MNGQGKSDRPIVPRKPSNKDSGQPVSAEGVEGRGLAKGKPLRLTRPRTLSRYSLQSGLQRLRQAAQRVRERGEKLTALWHHVYNVDRLRESYFELNRRGAPGVDRVTWQQYGEDLEGNLARLSSRLRAGAYRARPVRRSYVPKGDGSRRAIGVPTLEDKIVQRSFAEVIGAVYEGEFLGFSYGFRRRRGPHHALDAVAVAIERKKVNWVLDADIRGFFDAIDHGWLIRFVEHRIADRRVIRHVKKWLRAGVLVAGQRVVEESGTPQGGSVSPLLANIYLHYAFDLWAHAWRRRHAKGDVVLVRYGDDFLVGFQHQAEAERFLGELKERFRKFHLELHRDKTRLLEFGRFAAERRARRGLGKPETFNFLGLTHICGQDRRGRFALLRYTMRQRQRRKLREVKEALRRRRHDDVPTVGRWLRSVLVGHYRYYGVPRNFSRLDAFRDQVKRHWLRALRRRSQKDRTPWPRLRAWADRYIPRPRIYHPHPSQRLHVRPEAGAQ